MVTLGKGLPEWGGPGIGDGIEGKTHDASVGTVQKASGGLVDQKPRLVLNPESTHSHSVSDEITRDGTGTISDRDWDGLTGGALTLLESARSARIEAWSTSGARSTR